MNARPVALLPEAEGDIRKAQAFYEGWRTDGAAHFERLMDESIRRLEFKPSAFPKRYRHFRRFLLHHSYYAVFFVIEPHRTLIVAVLDLRQRPARLRRTLRTRR